MIIILIILNLFLVNSLVFDPFHLLSKSNICDCDLELSKLSEKTQEIVHFNDGILDIIPKHINYNIFKKMTEILPELHKTGDTMLQENDKFINYILELENLNPELKKKVIKFLLILTIKGDHFASNILEVYKILVDHIM